MKPKSLLESAGLAVLYVLPIANAFFKSWHVDSFHHPHPVASIPRAVLLLVLLVWALAWLAIVALDRLPPRGRTAGWITLSTLLVWLFGRVAAGISGNHPAAVSASLATAHVALPIVLLALLLLWKWRPQVLGTVLEGIRSIFTIAAFGLLILVPKLAWQAFRFEPPEQTSFANPSLASAPDSPETRIVWILMDELSYDQVFGHRPSGLSFQNFEDFARQSTSFSDVQPTGYHTEEVIPGLILGRQVADLEHIYGRPFRYRSASRGAWYPYDPESTIFGDARRLGWTTGLAGWFNPYCRFLRPVLDRCSWQSSDPYPGVPVQLFYNRSTLQNLRALLPLHERMDPLVDKPQDHVTHVRDYVEVMAQSESLIRDRRIRLVMLHLPVPHTPGIYDRGRHALVPGGNYIDNLVLADETLGRLMKLIQSTPDAPETSVIVSSDHSWRIGVWKQYPDWTPEETRLSGGQFDPRPVLMVRLPQADAATGDSGQVISQPVSAMIVHSVLEGLLRGSLHSPADIRVLVRQQGTDATAAGQGAGRKQK